MKLITYYAPDGVTSVCLPDGSIENVVAGKFTAPEEFAAALSLSGILAGSESVSKMISAACGSTTLVLSPGDRYVLSSKEAAVQIINVACTGSCEIVFNDENYSFSPEIKVFYTDYVAGSVTVTYVADNGYTNSIIIDPPEKTREIYINGTNMLDVSSWMQQCARKQHNGISVHTASYTIAAGDLGVTIVMDSASANTLTVPLSTTTDLGANTIVYVLCKGAGTTTITAASGVTLVGVADVTTGKSVSLRRDGTTDTWYIV